MEQIQSLVTVYIPTYNRLELLKRAVKSVQEQTYRNLEIIIVDDCSTDGTQDYLIQLAQQDQRIHYFFKEKNSGACVSRNIAIENATGEFITGLDDDDYFLKERISIFMEYMLDNPNYAYFTLTNIKKSEDKIILGKTKIFKPRKITKSSQLLKQNYIGNQIFIKTEILKRSKGFDPSFKAWQDLECWYNLLKNLNINFYLISQSTQVIDISHTHERITTNKINNVRNAWLNLSKKHHLTSYEKFILEGQLINYKSDEFSIFKRIILFLLTLQFFYLKSIIGGK